jgi:hypothetical protein
VATVQPWTRAQIEEIAKREYKNFRGLKIQGGDFSNLDLEKADFRGGSFPYSKFNGSNIKFADFEGANIMFTHWDDCILHRTNLKDAKMSGADMSKAKDFFGVTLTMDCNSFMGVKLKEGHWLGFLFYGLLMVPPTEALKEKLQVFFGEDRFTTLRNLYASRRL